MHDQTSFCFDKSTSVRSPSSVFACFRCDSGYSDLRWLPTKKAPWFAWQSARWRGLRGLRSQVHGSPLKIICRYLQLAGESPGNLPHRAALASARSPTGATGATGATGRSISVPLWRPSMNSCSPSSHRSSLLPQTGRKPSKTLLPSSPSSFFLKSFSKGRGYLAIFFFALLL